MALLGYATPQPPEGDVLGSESPTSEAELPPVPPLSLPTVLMAQYTEPVASTTAPEVFGGVLQGLSAVLSAFSAVLNPRASPAASPPETQHVPAADSSPTEAQAAPTTQM